MGALRDTSSRTALADVSSVPVVFTARVIFRCPSRAPLAHTTPRAVARLFQLVSLVRQVSTAQQVHPTARTALATPFRRRTQVRALPVMRATLPARTTCRAPLALWVSGPTAQFAATALLVLLVHLAPQRRKGACTPGTYSSMAWLTFLMPAGKACPSSSCWVFQRQHDAVFVLLVRTTLRTPPFVPRPPMKYCNLTTTSTTYNCPDGWYSLGGAWNCTVCPAGYYCPTDSTDGKPLACTGGATSAAGSTTCQVCPAGFSCPNAYTQIACVTGTYSLSNQTSCTVCPPGSYCPSTTLAPISCPAGTFSIGGSVAFCTSCNSTASTAYYQNETNKTTCNICPAGYMCPNSYSNPVPCPIGYVSSAGAFTCTPVLLV